MATNINSLRPYNCCLRDTYHRIESIFAHQVKLNCLWASLFKKSKIQKFKCQLMADLINKLCYIHVIEHHTFHIVVRINKTLLYIQNKQGFYSWAKEDRHILSPTTRSLKTGRSKEHSQKFCEWASVGREHGRGLQDCSSFVW